MLEDFDQVEFAMNQMNDAAGAADAEMSVIEDSLDYKLNALKQTWVGVIQDMANRGDIGEIIDSLTDTSEVLGDTLEQFTPVIKAFFEILNDGLKNLLPILKSIKPFVPMLAMYGTTEALGGGFFTKGENGKISLKDKINDAPWAKWINEKLGVKTETEVPTESTTTPLDNAGERLEQSGLDLQRAAADLSNAAADLLGEPETEVPEVESEPETPEPMDIPEPIEVPEPEPIDNTGEWDNDDILNPYGDDDDVQIDTTPIAEELANTDKPIQADTVNVDAQNMPEPKPQKEPSDDIPGELTDEEINALLEGMARMQAEKEQESAKQTQESVSEQQEEFNESDQVSPENSDSEIPDLLPEDITDAAEKDEQALNELGDAMSQTAEQITGETPEENHYILDNEDYLEDPLENMSDSAEVLNEITEGADEAGDALEDAEESSNDLSDTIDNMGGAADTLQDSADGAGEDADATRDDANAHQELVDSTDQGSESQKKFDMTLQQAGDGLTTAGALATGLGSAMTILGETIDDDSSSLKNFLVDAGSFVTQLGLLGTGVGQFVTALSSMGITAGAALGVIAPIALAIGAVGFAAYSVIDAENTFVESSKELGNSLQEMNKDFDEAQVKIDELEAKLKDSNTTYEETIEIKKELAEIENDLNDKYDLEGEHLQLTSQSAKSATINIEKYGKAVKKANKEQVKSEPIQSANSVSDNSISSNSVSDNTVSVNAAVSQNSLNTISSNVAEAVGDQPINVEPKSLENTAIDIRESAEKALGNLGITLNTEQLDSEMNKARKIAYENMSTEYNAENEHWFNADTRTATERAAEEYYNAYKNSENDIGLGSWLNMIDTDSANYLLSNGFNTRDQGHFVGGGTAYYSYSGTLEEEIEALKKYKEYIKTLNWDDDRQGKFITQIDKKISALEDKTGNIGEVAKERVYNELISGNADLEKSYESVNAILDEFNEAQEAGDTDRMSQISHEYADLMNQIKEALANTENADEIIGFFGELGPEIQDQINQWNLTAEIQGEKVTVEHDENTGKNTGKITYTDSQGNEIGYGDSYQYYIDMIKNAINDGFKFEDLQYTSDSSPFAGMVNELQAKATQEGCSSVSQFVEILMAAAGLEMPHWTEEDWAAYQGKQTKQNINKTLGWQYKGAAGKDAEGNLTTFSDYYDAATQDEQATMQTEAFTDALFKQREEIEAGTREWYNYADAVKEASNANKTEAESFSLTNVSSVTDGISQVSEMLSKAKEAMSDGSFTGIDISELEGLRDTFTNTESGLGVSTEAFEKWENTLASSSSTMADIQEATDDFATEIVDTKLQTGEMTAADRDLMITQLQLAGATKESATAYVDNAIALSQGVESVKQAMEDSNTASEIQGAILSGDAAKLDAVCEKYGVTKQQLAAYYSQKILADGLTLSTSADINNLIALCNQLGIATNGLIAFNNAKNGALSSTDLNSDYNKVKAKGLSADGKKGGYYQALNAMSSHTNSTQRVAQTELELANKKLQENMKKLSVTPPGGSSTDGGGGSDAADDADKLTDKINELTSAYSNLLEIVEAYNENGEITLDQASQLVDMDFKYLATLKDENGQIAINTTMWDQLTGAKREQMVTQLALNAIDTLNSLATEADAVEFLSSTYDSLASSSLNAAEAQLAAAVAGKKALGGAQAQAADQIMQGYEASKKMIMSAVLKGKDDTDSDKDTTDKTDDTTQEETKNDFSQEFDWIQRKLDKLNKIIEHFDDQSEKYFSWSKKNAELQKANEATGTAISAYQSSIAYYKKELNKIKIPKKYKDLIENGGFKIQTVKRENLANKLQKYIDLTDAITEAQEAIEELYDKERDRIEQSLSNITEYYDTIISKYEAFEKLTSSQVSEKEAWGAKEDSTDIITELANLNKTKEQTAKEVEDYAHADADKEYQEVIDDNEERITNIQDTATYKSLQEKYNELASKKAEDLTDNEKALMQKYQKEMADMTNETDATNILDYQKNWEKYYKYREKLIKKYGLSEDATDEEIASKLTKKNELKKWNSLVDDIHSDDTFQKEANAAAEKLAQTEFTFDADGDGENEESVTRAFDKKREELEQTYQDQWDAYNDIADTKQYQDIKNKRDVLQNKKDSGKTLTKKEEAALEKYNAELKALEEGGLSSNVSEYIKTWEALYKEQSKSEEKQNAKTIDALQAKLKAWNTAKDAAKEEINTAKEEAIAKLEAEYDTELANLESADAEKSAEIGEKVQSLLEYDITYLSNVVTLLDSTVDMLQSKISTFSSVSLDRARKLLGDEAFENLGLNDYNSTSAFVSSNYKQEMNAQKQSLSAQYEIYDMYKKLAEAGNSGDYSSILDQYENVDASTINKIKTLLSEHASDWGTSEWVAAWEEGMDDAEQAIYTGINNIQSTIDDFREYTISVYKEQIEQLESYKSKWESIASMINDDWLYDSNGITEFGMAKANALSAELTQAQGEVGEYKKTLDQIDADWENNPEETFGGDYEAYQKARAEAEADYWNSVSNAYGIAEQIYNLAQQAQEEEIDALEETVSKYKEALESKKAYYDYDKTLKEQTKSVELLQAEIAALNGVNTAEANAKRAQLESDLQDAQDELEDTKKEHEYELQTDALDDLIEDLRDALEDSADTIEETFEHFSETVQSMMAYAEDADLSGSLQKIVDLVMGKYSSTASTSTDTTVDTSTDTATTSTDDVTATVDTSTTTDYTAVTAENVTSMNDNIQAIYKMQQAFFGNNTVQGLAESLASAANNLDAIKLNTDEIKQTTANINLNVGELIRIDSVAIDDLKTTLERATSQATDNTIKAISNQLRTLGYRVKY